MGGALGKNELKWIFFLIDWRSGSQPFFGGLKVPAKEKF